MKLENRQKLTDKKANRRKEIIKIKKLIQFKTEKQRRKSLKQKLVL